jgi:hypothetical protein
MKHFIYLAFVGAALFIASCTDGSSDLGLNIRPTGDEIILGTDTFHVSTSSYAVDRISSPTDTLLLGTFQDRYHPEYGTTTGEILAQFTCPAGFKFPTKSVPDSLVLVVLFNTWTGSSKSPVEISAYELNKKTLDYNTTYYTNQSISEFCDKSQLMGSRITVAVPDTVSDTTTYQPHIAYNFNKLNKNGISYAQMFYNAVQNGAFADKDAFNQYFKGILLTPTFTNGGAMWYVNQMYLKLYYHYPAFVNNKDTTLTSGLNFPASKDVRQINVITTKSGTNKNQNLDLSSIPDSLNYLSTPAGIYTKVSLPIGRILQSVKSQFAGKVQGFNHANLQIQATHIDSVNSYIRKLPQKLALIRKSNLDNRFIEQYNYTTDTLYTATYNSTTESYNFNLAGLFTNYLKTNKGLATEDWVLVPISISATSSSTGSVLSFHPQITMGAATIRSGKHDKKPMRIDLIYSGF